MARNVLWRLVEIAGAEFLTFGFMIILARLLLPDDYGIVAIAGGLILVAQAVVYHGLAEAVIQADELDDGLFDTAYWANLAVGCAAAAALALFAWPLATLLDKPDLAPVLAALSLGLVMMGGMGVLQAVLRRELRFGALAVRSVLAVSVGGAVGVALAWAGAGPWALVGQQLGHATAGLVALRFSATRLPGTRFSRRDLAKLSPMATRVAITWLVETGCRYLMPVLLGAFLSSALVGLYFLASRLVASLSMLTFMSVGELCLPVLARMSHDEESRKQAVYLTIRVTTLVCLPSFIGLAMIADPLVVLLVGEGWRDAIPVVRLLAVMAILPAWLAVSLQVFVAHDASGAGMRLNLMVAVVLVALVLPAASFGLLPAVAALGLSYLIVLPRAVYDLRRIAGLDLNRLGTEQLPVLAATIAMAACMALADGLIPWTGEFVRLVVTILVAKIVYVGSMLVLAPSFAREMAAQLAAALSPQREAARAR